MNIKSHDSVSVNQHCQCGWVVSSQQQVIWSGKEQKVCRVCPSCGTLSPLRNKIILHGQPSRQVH